MDGILRLSKNLIQRQSESINCFIDDGVGDVELKVVGCKASYDGC